MVIPIWKDWAKILKDVLHLEGSPVSITYSIDEEHVDSKEKRWVCTVLKDARDGKSIILSKENSACPGGSMYLGFVPRATGKESRGLQKFLVNGEKLYCSVAVFHRAAALASQPPLKIADYVLFSPMEDAEKEPDLVIFLCNAEQACRLLTLATFSTGISPRTEMVGSACHMAITYPLVSGEINVSFLDYTARKMKKYNPNELVVSVPYHHMHGIMASMTRCTAGTAKTEIPPEFARLLKDLKE